MARFFPLCLLLAAACADSRVARAWETTAERPFVLTVSPVERSLLSDAVTNNLSGRRLIEAALIAGGVEDRQQVRQFQQQVDQVETDLFAADAMALPARQRARLILSAMHDQLFAGGYQTDCSSLDQALTLGRMNCVSATVVFNAMAQRLGLHVVAAERPGHVVSQIRLEGQWWEIETTQAERRWTKLESKATGQISAPALVAIVYYNRAWQSFAAKDYEQSVILNAKACQMDAASAGSLRNLLIAINHWALQESDSGNHLRALELITYGQSLAPEDAALLANRAVVLQRQQTP